MSKRHGAHIIGSRLSASGIGTGLANILINSYFYIEEAPAGELLTKRQPLFADF
jgi:hypothetical protein